MRLLFLAVLRRHTGNAVTARRVRVHLEAAGHVCILKDALDFESPAEIASLVEAHHVDAALALHLYRGGRLLQGLRVPFGIIFGGTDLNEDVNQGEKNEVMGRVLEKARFAVAFTEAMKEAAHQQWNRLSPGHSKSYVVIIKQGSDANHPALESSLRVCQLHELFPAPGGLPHARGKIHVQSQGVAAVPNPTFNWDAFLERSGISRGANHLHVFLLICGLRQVKDPLFLLDAFSEWHREEPSVYMVIVGPEVDPVFSRAVKAKVERSAGVRLVGEMAQADLHAVVKNCSALVNSSVSEGMSAAILEAMALEVPVLARRIPGNTAVVQHGVTGLLFSDPQEFVQLAKQLVSDPTLGKEIVTHGREYVRARHSWRAERDTYQHLVRTLEHGAQD